MCGPFDEGMGLGATTAGVRTRTEEAPDQPDRVRQVSIGFWVP
jgi:hypothetical protein